MADKIVPFWSALIFVIIILPPVSERLESSMIGVMLIQIPGLILTGYLLGRFIGKNSGQVTRYNDGGVPGLLLSIFAILFWLLPRYVDLSLTNETVKLVKITSLPLMSGIPLGISWNKLHPIGQGVVKGNFISMLIVMSWLYLSVPVRLCNNYLESQQKDLGKMIVIIAVLLSMKWAAQAFTKKTKV
jgi:hypothetical protein